MTMKVAVKRTFVLRSDQVDMRKLRYASVVVCAVFAPDGEILLVKRSQQVAHYKGWWSGPAGFLDDLKTKEQKVREEILKELHLKDGDIFSLEVKTSFESETPDGKQTFHIYPAMVRLKTKRVRIDWEATQYRWVSPTQLYRYRKIVPNFWTVLRALRSD